MFDASIPHFLVFLTLQVGLVVPANPKTASQFLSHDEKISFEYYGQKKKKHETGSLTSSLKVI